jgi:hypothetical protein
VSVAFSLYVVDFDWKLLQFKEFAGDSSADLLWVAPVLQVHVIGEDSYVVWQSCKQWSPVTEGFNDGKEF